MTPPRPCGAWPPRFGCGCWPVIGEPVFTAVVIFIAEGPHEPARPEEASELTVDDAQPLRGPGEMGRQVGVPGVGQAWEAGAEGVVVGADQRVEPEEIDVVGDQHDRAPP